MHGLERYRKVRRLLLERETFFYVGMWAIDNDPVSPDIGWKKERESLDVIPVGVAQEQVRCSPSSAELAVHEMLAEDPYPRTCIKDDSDVVRM